MSLTLMSLTLRNSVICLTVLIQSIIGSGVLKAQSQSTQTTAASSVFFTKNMGQWPDSVLFRTDAGGATIWILKDKLIYQFQRKVDRQPSSTGTERGLKTRAKGHFDPALDSIEQLLITAHFIGSIPNVQVTAENPTDFKFNYFLGNDPAKWAVDVPSYGTVTLRGIYDGVDLRFASNERGNLTHDYVLGLNADQCQIKIEYEGVEPASIDASGTITAQSGWGEINGLLATPTTLAKSSELVFGESEATGAEDFPEARSPQAVQLVFSTYLGGGVDERGESIAVDSSGNVYVAGWTTSSNFPAQNPVDGSYNGGVFYGDAFVSKLSSSGSTLLYSTYLGGTGDDYGYGIAVDTSGNAYVTGQTSSADFPLQNPYDASLSGAYDAFVCRLAPSGSSLLYSTYLGGSGDEWTQGIAVDASGNAYLTGQTGSADFPLQNPYDASLDGGVDVFVTKLASSGTSLVYSTYLGGSGINGEQSWAIAVDTDGNAYVTGITGSADFPTENPYDNSLNNTWDAFVSKLSSSGNVLLYSTYLGGNGEESCIGIAVDASGNAYVTGTTWSSDFPVQTPYDGTLSAAPDAFVSKLSPLGNVLVYSTYLGGNDVDEGYGIAVDAFGSAYVTGWTNSTNFPVQNPFDGNLNAGDAFVSKFYPSGNTLRYSTFLGGTTGLDWGTSIAISGFGNAYVTGLTASSNFPVQNAYDGSYNGIEDVFVSCLSTLVDDCAGVSPITWSIGNVGTSLWPTSHWNQFSYCDQPTPCGECCINCSSSDFPDWESFVTLIGVGEAYFDPPPGETKYRPSALNQWRAIKGPWSGSCFGFASAYYLYLDGFRSLATDFPGSVNLSQVPLNSLSRSLINDHFHYQYGFAQQQHVAAELEAKTPVSTLIECQQMFTQFPRNDRVLMMFNQSGAGAHALAAYRCLQDGGDPDIRYLYVHDSNFPNDTTKRIAINTATNTWSYSAQPGWGGDKGLFLMDSVSNYMSPLVLEDTSTTPQVMTVYFGETDSATFVTPMFGAFGFNTDSLFGEIPGSYPIIPADGQETSPIGYFLPAAYYNYQIVGVESGQCIINYGDNIQWRVGGAKSGIISASVTAAADNVNIYAGAAKSLQEMFAVCDTQFVELVLIEPDSEIVIQVQDIDIVPGDSITFSIAGPDVVQLDNYGAATNYDLSMRVVSATIEEEFYYADVPIATNTAHQIYIDWRANNDSVLIEIDSGRTGDFDESVMLAGQAAPTFVCGDADGNGIVTISDAVYLINYIFSGGPAPNPIFAGDADCNGIVTISDAVYLINFIFSGGPSPCAVCQ